MSDHPLKEFMDTAISKIKEMVDVNTIVGEQITIPDGTTIIPISKIVVGFGSGGSEFPGKSEKMPFGGGSGAGISILPVAFLVIQEGNVRLLQVGESTNSTEKFVDAVPEAVGKIIDIFKKNKEEQKNKDNKKDE